MLSLTYFCLNMLISILDRVHPTHLIQIYFVISKTCFIIWRLLMAFDPGKLYNVKAAHASWGNDPTRNHVQGEPWG